jgi:restriction system protein
MHVFAGLCFLSAAVSFVRRLMLKRKFDLQRSLDDLRALTWREFEAIVGEAFRRQGYAVTETGQGGPDGGVDLMLTRDGQRYLVQCKQYRTWTVSVRIVREIFGVVAARKADGAIVVTTGKFTNDAVDFAKGQPIELIDGRRLEAMVREINVGGAPLSGSGTRRDPTIDGVSSPTDAAPGSRSPSSPAAVVAVGCPMCGATMVRRTARAGGAAFYGCSTFPKCRGTRPML